MLRDSTGRIKLKMKLAVAELTPLIALLTVVRDEATPQPPNSKGLFHFRHSDSYQQVDLFVSQWEGTLEGVLPLSLLKDKLHLTYDLVRPINAESLLWTLCRAQGPFLIESQLLSPSEVIWASDEFSECF